MLHDLLSGTAIYQAGDVAAMAPEAGRGFEPLVLPEPAGGENQPHRLGNQ